MAFREDAERLFGQLQKSLKRLELEMEYNHDVHLQQQKCYQDSLGLIAELESLIMLQDEREESLSHPPSSQQSVSFDDKDHQLLMTQLKDNINLVNDYKQQIQEIRRQNQLINKLARDNSAQLFAEPVLKENEADSLYRKRQARNFERVKDIERKIKEKRKSLFKMQRRVKEKDYDYRLLSQMERLDEEIEKITDQIRYLID